MARLHRARSRRVGLVVACAAVTVMASPKLLTSQQAAARGATTASLTPTSGPVGTVVRAQGNVGAACAAQAAQATQGGATLFLQFQKGPGYGQPNEWLNVPVAADGSWSASFMIPAFVGGQAMTQGSLGANVNPGTWQFGLPACNGPAPLVNFQVTGTASVPSRFVAMASTPSGHGYWLVQADGGVFAFGDAPYLGSLPGLGLSPPAAVTGFALTPDGSGYWLVDGNGDVFTFGDAVFYGSLPGAGVSPLGQIVGIVSSHDGRGYWLVGADGGVFTFGDASYLGNGQDGVPKVALLPTPDGRGYLLPTSTGIAPDALGDAVPMSRPPIALSALLSEAAITIDGGGYWEVGTDGGIFGFGDAVFYGSLPSVGVTASAPIIGMARTPDGRGYWLLGADGGVFTFGSATFAGSAAPLGLPW